MLTWIWIVDTVINGQYSEKTLEPSPVGRIVRNAFSCFGFSKDPINCPSVHTSI